MRRLLSPIVSAAIIVVAASACNDPTKATPTLVGRVESLTPPNMTVGGRSVITTPATIVARGNARVAVTDLHVGQTVQIQGEEHGDGSVEAHEIDVEDDDVEVRGTIEALQTSSLKVAGKVIRVDAATKVEKEDAKITFADLKVGDTVKVEAAPQTDGSLLAREIEIKSGDEDKAEGPDEPDHPDEPRDETEFRGAIESLALPALTVSGHQVVTNAGTEFERQEREIAATDLRVGDSVKVEGKKQADGSVLAREIEVKGGQATPTVTSVRAVRKS